MSGLLLTFRQGWIGSGLCRSCRLSLVWQPQRNSSSEKTVSRMNRHKYPQPYSTVLSLPDGSTITLHYREPRKSIRISEDLSLLSEAERKLRLQRRKPKQKLVIEDDMEEDLFDVSQYSHLWKK